MDGGLLFGRTLDSDPARLRLSMVSSFAGSIETSIEKVASANHLNEPRQSGFRYPSNDIGLLLKHYLKIALAILAQDID